MPPFCEICGTQDGRATFWFDVLIGNYTQEIDDSTPPLSTYQVCSQCQDRFQSGQWKWTFTPNTLTVIVLSTNGQSQVIH